MQNILIVMAGGAIGAGARYGIGRLVLPAGSGGWPSATLIVNIVGSLLMGVLIALLVRQASATQEPLRLFAGVGVLGGFTTFSAFSMDAVQMIERGQWASMLAYVLLSVVGSILALMLGMAMVRGTAA